MSSLSKNVLRRVCLRAVAVMWLLAPLFPLSTAHAAVISLSTPVAAVTQGSVFAVTVRASDLLPGGLSGYSFDLSYMSGVLAFDHVVDAQGLGNAFGLFFAAQGDVLSFADVSFDDAQTLLALQGPSVDLFTIYFRAIGAGDSALSLSSVSLVDAVGGDVPFTADGGSVSVLPSLTVPEPGTLPLLVVGGLMVFCARRGVIRE